MVSSSSVSSSSVSSSSVSSSSVSPITIISPIISFLISDSSPSSFKTVNDRFDLLTTSPSTNTFPFLLITVTSIPFSTSIKSIDVSSSSVSSSSVSSSSVSSSSVSSSSVSSSSSVLPLTDFTSPPK